MQGDKFGFKQDSFDQGDAIQLSYLPDVFHVTPLKDPYYDKMIFLFPVNGIEINIPKKLFSEWHMLKLRNIQGMADMA
jgi:hypothetical protein